MGQPYTELCIPQVAPPMALRLSACCLQSTVHPLPRGAPTGCLTGVFAKGGDSICLQGSLRQRGTALPAELPFKETFETCVFTHAGTW